MVVSTSLTGLEQKLSARRRSVSGLTLLDELVSRISSSASGGPSAVYAEAERCLEKMSGLPASILVNAANRWRQWRVLDLPEDESAGHALPDDAADLMGARSWHGRVLLPIREGCVVAVLQVGAVPLDKLSALDVIAQCIDMALALSDRSHSIARTADELGVMRNVAGRILQSSDLDAILLLVSHETRQLLAADICGVMLLDGDELVMRSCVGHFSATTAKLRMHSGVGVAGQVLATGKPCVVVDYVVSDNITHDFVPLARIEKVRSAAAVPIRSSDNIIGILEVWRRRPSSYGEEDTGLLLALAGLAALAIENGRLFQARVQTADDLAIANAALAARYDAIEQTARFQEVVQRLMLEDHPLASLAERTAEFTSGKILILGQDLGVEAASSQSIASDEALLYEIGATIRRSNHLSEKTINGEVLKTQISVQPVLGGREIHGWIVWLGNTPAVELTQLALGSVALASAMHFVERRRIARERSGTIQAVLWDLLEGTDALRAVAWDRARELHVELKGLMCVVVATLINASQPARGDSDSVVKIHEALIDRLRVCPLARHFYMAGFRGDQIRLVCRFRERDDLAANISEMREQVRRLDPSMALVVGVSSAFDEKRGLSTAFREALVALEVARHRVRTYLAHYDDVGVMGLLINLRTKADIQRIRREIFSHLMEEPEQKRQILLDTLVAFFDENCSQAGAAKRLRVHQKTIAYRLSRISQLTGLDLARHEDRVLADVATKLNALVTE